MLHFDYFNLLLLFIFLFLIFKKFNILLDNVEYSPHKNIINFDRKPLLLGGIYIFISILLFFSNEHTNLKIFSFLILILGIASDKNYINNPILRLILQIFFLILFVFFENLSINSIKISFFDSLLENNYFNIFFTTFCIAILINGTNFIDGLNSLVSNYFIIVILALLILNKYYLNFQIDNMYEIKILLFVLIVFTFFNFFGYTFLGDSGSYLVSFILGYFLINIYNQNQDISPYFIVLLLWYPAFENFFSILRRLFNKIHLSNADNLHLHHMVLNSFKHKSSNKFLNSYVSLLIIFYNLIIFAFSIKFYYHTKILIMIIFINILAYLVTYFYLRKKTYYKI